MTVMERFSRTVSFVLLGLVFMLPAMAFETGALLSFGVEPATIRQRAETQTAKVQAVVKLQEPSPAFFILKIRSQDADQISFPSIVFRKGDVRGTSDGVVYWKAVKREARVRLSAYNTDAPDQQLSFTVTLKPVPPPDSTADQPQQ
jgi:hypothetical protein